MEAVIKQISSFSKQAFMKIILFIITFFLNSILFAQGGYSDLKEYGLYANPKIVHTCYYADIIFINGNWQPLDTSRYAMKRVYYFNKNGFIDSSDIEMKTAHSVVVNKTINSFNNGQKTGYTTYNNGIMAETSKINWLDSFSYTTITYDTAGNITAKDKNTLNKDYRDYKGEYTLYNREGDSIISRSGSYVNSFDEKNHLRSAMVIQDDIKTAVENIYVHDNIDKHKNFLRTVITEGGKDKPKYIVIKKINYY